MVATRSSSSQSSHLSLIPHTPSECSVETINYTDHSDSDFEETIIDTLDPKQKKALTTARRIPLWKKVLHERYDNAANYLSTTWEYWARDKARDKYKLTDKCKPDDHHVIESRIRMYWTNTLDWGSEESPHLILTVTLYDNVKKQPSILIQGYSTPIWTYNEFVFLIRLVTALGRGEDISTSCRKLLALPNCQSLPNAIASNDSENEEATINVNTSMPLLLPETPTKSNDKEDEEVTFNLNTSTLLPLPANTLSSTTIDNSGLAHDSIHSTLQASKSSQIPSGCAVICQEVIEFFKESLSPQRASSNDLPINQLHNKTSTSHALPSANSSDLRHPGTISIPNFNIYTSLVLMANSLYAAQSEIQDLKSEIREAKNKLPQDLHLLRIQILNEQKPKENSIQEQINDLSKEIELLQLENKTKDLKIKKLEDKITSLSHEIKTKSKDNKHEEKKKSLKEKDQNSKSSQTISSKNDPEHLPSFLDNTKKSRQSSPPPRFISPHIPFVNEVDDAQKQNPTKSFPPHNSSSPRTLVVGDSNLRHIKSRRLDPKGDTAVRTIPGVTIGRLTEKLKDGLVEGDYQRVILHVGTNDVGNLHSHNQILNDTKALIKQCRSLFPEASLAMTQILPRPYMHMKVNSINRDIRELCIVMNVQWIDLPIEHSSDNFQRDGVHLNKKGMITLVRLLRPQPSQYSEKINTIVGNRDETNHVFPQSPNDVHEWPILSRPANQYLHSSPPQIYSKTPNFQARQNRQQSQPSLSPAKYTNQDQAQSVQQTFPVDHHTQPVHNSSFVYHHAQPMHNASFVHQQDFPQVQQQVAQPFHPFQDHGNMQQSPHVGSYVTQNIGHTDLQTSDDTNQIPPNENYRLTQQGPQHFQFYLPTQSQSSQISGYGNLPQFQIHNFDFANNANQLYALPPTH